MTANLDPKEVEKFESIGDQWWDATGPFKPLHELNPLRLRFVTDRVNLTGKSLLDIGCGGGIFAEALSRTGAKVSGIDLSPAAIRTAQQHAQEQSLAINYQVISAEDYAAQHPNQFAMVTCMELLEHVPDPARLIQACSDLAQPGGDVFFSTLHRNLKSYLHAIIGAEYLLKLLPQGTHDYAKFIRPSELDSWARQAGLELVGLSGLSYSPWRKEYCLSDDVSVNYLAHFRKPHA